MIFCGNYETEKLVVHPIDDVNEAHYIEIAKDKDMPVFSVTCCCNDEWYWDFVYSKTNYEVVKYLTMASIVECDTMEELMDLLDEVYEEECYHMIYDEDEYECDYECCGEEEEEDDDDFECDGDCANCECFYED